MNTSSKKYTIFFSIIILLFQIIPVFAQNGKVQKVISNEHTASQLEIALSKAGKNKDELIKTLKHYKSNPLKYKASKFLIENMQYHYGYDGDALSNYWKYFSCISLTKKSYSELVDSLQKSDGYFAFESLHKVQDITTISASYLIDNIDFAFKVWKEQPWGKNVSFYDFCEYILPYRIGDEKLMKWREMYYKKFNPILNNIRKLPQAEDPIFAAQTLLDSLYKEKYYFTETFPIGPHVGPQILNWRSGSCQDLTDYLTYIFRSIGLPGGCDMMLMRGDNNVGHFWNFVLDKTRHTYFCSLLYASHKMEEASTYWNPKGKVYRDCFGLNNDIISDLGSNTQYVYPTFQIPLIRDVTQIYAAKKNQTLNISLDKLYRMLKTDEKLYLCMSSYTDWIPVGWGKIFDNKIIIKYVEGGVVFCMATYRNGIVYPLSDPFLVNRDTGNITFYEPQKDKENVVLLHKFNLFIEPFIDRMVGGVFEASNDSNFQNKDTLFTIRNKPVRLYNTVPIETAKEYRYVRYFGPKDGYCNVAEISFYQNNKDTIPLKGNIHGTPGCTPNDKSHEYTNAFDGNPYTSFDYYKPYGGWTGLDLEHPYKIRKIIYTPRNRMNFIIKGSVYELLYYKHGNWLSAGIQKAQSDSLLYSVPKNSLLYLRCHSSGTEERIFEYKDGKQIFW
jgi:hypothetical protein